MAAAAAGSGGLSRFLRPGARFQSTDVTAAMTWGVAAGAGALWLVQVRNSHSLIPLALGRPFIRCSSGRCVVSVRYRVNIKSADVFFA